jgi:hypothetical protein
MGLVASLVHTSTLPTKARERFAVISSRVIEALGLSSSQTTPRVRAHDDDSLELGAYGWLHKLRRAALVANTDQPDRFNARLKPEAENRDPLVRASLMNWQHAELT